MQIQTYQIIFFLLFIFLLLTVIGVGCYIIKRCGNPFPKLFFELDKKMWMTVGLGFTFFGFYYVFIKVLSWIIKGENIQKIFTFFHEHTEISIYLGLFIFSFVTLSIYWVRLLIKFLYRNFN